MSKSHSRESSTSSRRTSLAAALVGISNVSISATVPRAAQRSNSASSVSSAATQDTVRISVISRDFGSSPTPDTSVSSPSSPGAVSSPKAWAPATQNTAVVPSDIFCNDSFKLKQDIPLPNVGDHFESTAQLVACAKLLAWTPPDISDPPMTNKNSSADKLNPSPSQLKWIQEMNDRPLEKVYIQQLMNAMVDKFIVLPRKTPEAIHEIILLGPVLGKGTYRALLNRFLHELKTDVVINTDLLQGLIRLVERAPPFYLKADDLIKILRTVRDHLMDSAQQEAEYTLHLTVTISKVLLIMVACEVKDLNREEEHQPLLEALSKLRKHADPSVRYQVEYTYRALQLIPNDETAVQGLTRNALRFAGGLMTVASVIQLDFGGVPDGLPVLIKSGRGLVENLKKYFGTGDKNPWFRTVCEAEVMVSEGRLVDFNHLICEADCRQDPFFRWGICQILDEMAVDPSWSATTCEQAIRLLGEMFKITTASTQYQDVQRYILTVLRDISDLPSADQWTKTSNDAIKYQALGLVLKFEDALDGESPLPPLARSALKFRPLPTSSSLLKEVSYTFDLDLALDRLRWQRQKTYSRHAVYIPPMSKPSLQASEDNPDHLHEQVHQFLKGNGLVMLILGDSGAGKSTFNARLEQDLWKEHNNTGLVPLFIDLKAVRNLDQDLVRQHLESLSIFSESHMKELLRSREFVLICDGYDESQSRLNLHTNSQLNKPNNWKAKMVISCRTQYLTPGYQSYFAPQPHGLNNTHTNPTELYKEAVVIPFKLDQIKEYIEQYTKIPDAFDNKPKWTAEQYSQRLETTTNIMDLIKNPFMLKMVLEILPKMDPATTQITRAELYDEFVDLHFENELNRLLEQRSRGKMSSDRLREFQEIEGPNFADRGIDFSKRLAHEIFQKEKGVNSIEYWSVEDKKSWKREFFGSDAITQLLLESSQLVSRASAMDSKGRTRIRSHASDNKVTFRFSHLSILEYFYALSIYDPREDFPQVSSADSLASSAGMISVTDHPLGERSLVFEPAILQFLADRVQSVTEFKEHLYTLVHQSSSDSSAGCAAANAITILVRAGERFNGIDLQGIRIPGADLTGGEFDSVQLQGADLRNAVLRNAWLRQADFSNSQMEGVIFGESPYLQENELVEDCVFSPDGSHLALALKSAVVVYETSTWSRTAFQVHTARVNTVAFSPSGQQIASGSEDMTVRLWDVHTGALSCTMSGHTGIVFSVAFSPCGRQVTSCSKDSTVRLWDAQTGAPGSVLNGHSRKVACVTYSPSGHQIASGSDDGTVRLWDAHTGSLIFTLTGDNSGVHSCVYSAVYSPSGSQIATGGFDNVIRLWDAETGSLSSTLRGHTDIVSCVAYSRDGQQIASSSWDSTVRLWDTQTGTLSSVLSGHSDCVKSVAYSPTRQQIASCSSDKTVRLWDTLTGGTLGSVLSGNTDRVNYVAYSPSGNQVASANDEKTVHLRDAHTGAVDFVLEGHTDIVASVAYSPSGEQIASACEDKTVRLWDAQTGAHLFTLSGHDDAVMVVTYSPCGRQVASGSWDQTIRLWDAQTGDLFSILSGGHTKAVYGVAYSPNGQQIASCSWDKTVRLWDAQTGALGAVLTGHTGNIHSVVYTPDGQRIASGSHDSTVRLWDAHTGTLIYVLSGHAGPALSVAISPSGKHVASVSRDKSMRLWDIESGQCLLVVDGFEDQVHAVAWGSILNDTYIITGSREKSIRSWKVVEGKGDLQVRLHWRSSPDTLVLTKAVIQGVEDLSENNMWLLQQSRAVGSNRAVSL